MLETTSAPFCIVWLPPIIAGTLAGKSETPPPDIRRREEGSHPFLTNEQRAHGSKDLTKQRELPSIFFKIITTIIIIFIIIKKIF